MRAPHVNLVRARSSPRLEDSFHSLDGTSSSSGTSTSLAATAVTAAAVAANEYGGGNADDERSFAAVPSYALRGAAAGGGGGRSGIRAPGVDACRARGRGAGVFDGGGGGGNGLFLFGEGGRTSAGCSLKRSGGGGGGGGIRGAATGSEQSISVGGGGGAGGPVYSGDGGDASAPTPPPPPPAVSGRRLAGEASAEQDLDRRGRRPAVEREGDDAVEGGRDRCRQGGATVLGLLASSSREGERAAEEKRAEGRLLAAVRALLRELEGDLDAARVLLPECHRFRQVVGCVAEAVGPGMAGARPRQAMDLTEALREATQFSRTLSSPEAFLVVMAELLADGFEVRTLREKPLPVVLCCVVFSFLLVFRLEYRVISVCF